MHSEPTNVGDLPSNNEKKQEGDCKKQKTKQTQMVRRKVHQNVKMKGKKSNIIQQFIPLKWKRITDLKNVSEKEKSKRKRRERLQKKNQTIYKTTTTYC